MLACVLSYNMVEKDHLKDLRIYVGTLEGDTLKNGIWTAKCIHLAPDSIH
jgi:hypothetical protein